MLNVTVDLRSALKMVDGLAKDLRIKAITRSLNETIAKAKTDAAKEIRSQGYNIRAAKIKDRIKIKKATSGLLTARLLAIDKPVNLIEYGAKPYGKGLRVVRDANGRLKPQTGGGVSVKVKGSRKKIPHAFIAGGRVYIRASQTSKTSGMFTMKNSTIRYRGGYEIKSEPVRQLIGPGVNQIVASKAIQKAMTDNALKYFPVRLMHHVSRAGQ